MADVKHWDLFPTKVFETKFVAKDDIINYINANQMKNDAPYFAHQSVNNNLQKVNILHLMKSNKLVLILSGKRIVITRIAVTIR